LFLHLVLAVRRSPLNEVCVSQDNYVLHESNIVLDILLISFVICFDITFLCTHWKYSLPILANIHRQYSNEYMQPGIAECFCENVVAYWGIVTIIPSVICFHALANQEARSLHTICMCNLKKAPLLSFNGTI